MFVDPNFKKFVFESYEKGENFDNIHLDIERGELIYFDSVCRILFFENFE